MPSVTKKQNKFQLQAVAAGLGLTPDETRRLLSGKATVEDVMKGKEDADPRVKANKLVAAALGDNTQTLEQLERTYQNALTEGDRFTIGYNKTMNDGIVKITKSLFGLEEVMGLNNMEDIMERAQVAAIRTAQEQGQKFDAEEFKTNFLELGKILKEGVIGGKMDFQTLRNLPMFKEMRETFTETMNQTPSERRAEREAMIADGDIDPSLRAGRSTAGAINKTVNALIKDIKNRFSLDSGGGKLSPEAKAHIEAQKAMKDSAEASKAATETLVTAFTGGGLELKLKTGTGKSIAATLGVSDAKKQLLKKNRTAKEGKK